MKDVSYFIDKVRRAELNLGIMLCWNGISREESGKYAKRYLDDRLPGDSFVIVLDAQDLYEILDGKCLYEILDNLLYDLRFDVVIE